MQFDVLIDDDDDAVNTPRDDEIFKINVITQWQWGCIVLKNAEFASAYFSR